MEKKEKITKKNKYSFYSKYYEYRFDSRSDAGLDFLENMMEKGHPNLGYVILAYLLTQTSHNVVVTTNFDHLTEDAVNRYMHTIPLVIGHESLSHYITGHTTRPVIVKIHRDILYDPCNTTEEVDSLNDEWKISLDAIFSKYHPVFIGYAGNDKSLMEYLIDNSEKFKNKKWKYPFWTLYKQKDPDGTVKRFLEKSEGYCVNCEGFDKLMCLIGARMGYQMPTEDEFVNDAKKIYNKLTEVFEDIAPNNFKGSKVSGKNLEEKAQREEIENALKKITEKTNFPKKFIDAIILHNHGKYVEAAKIEEVLVKEQKENALYHQTYGVTLHELKKYNEAEREKRIAVNLEPEKALYHISLGVTLHANKNLEEARCEKCKAVNLEPENALYHFSLGVTLHEQMKYGEAEAEKKKAVSLEPDNDRYKESLQETLDKKSKIK